MSFSEQRKLVLSFLQDYMVSLDKSYLDLISCRNLLNLTGSEPLNKKVKEKAITKIIKYNAEQMDLFRKTIDFVEQFYFNLVLPDSEKTDVTIPEGSMNFIHAAHLHYLNNLVDMNAYLCFSLKKAERAKLHSNDVFERMKNDADEAVKFIS